MHISRIVLLSAILGSILFTACEKKEYQTIEELDNQNINTYIQKNNLNVSQYKDTDLFYEIIKPGTGKPISYKETYPMVYTVKSLDGTFNANDTLSSGNRYMDYFGYFPFGSSYAGSSNSPVERQNDLKDVVKDILLNTNGQIRIIVPSRLTAWGRQGDRDLGIPANASLDYLITVYEDLDDYEDIVIQNAIVKAGFAVEEFEKTTDAIYYKILELGTGDLITADSTIVADYTLRNSAGETLQVGTDVSLNLAGGTITAWAKIIPLINKGGKIRLFTPSKFAYGISGGNSIGPFMSLDFEVEVQN